jgi:hypothetical protein
MPPRANNNVKGNRLADCGMAVNLSECAVPENRIFIGKGVDFLASLATSVHLQSIRRGRQELDAQIADRHTRWEHVTDREVTVHAPAGDFC